MANFILEDLDNKESAGQQFVGRVDRFKYDGFRFYFGSLYSSYVLSIVSDMEGSMVVNTKNSVYTFKRKM